MDTSNILTIIAFSIASILLVVDLIMCDTKEVVWKRKKLTADKARKISNDYSGDIDFIEKEIRQAAKQNKTSVELTIDSEKVVKHFENAKFVVTHIDKCIYNIDWSNDAKSKKH
ncbi:MAG: hypothetical protein ACLRYF_03835 [Mediterraneibacter faecis]|jgi:hypothetical protein